MKQKTPVNSQRKALGTLLPVEQHPPVNGVNRPPVPLFIEQSRIIYRVWKFLVVILSLVIYLLLLVFLVGMGRYDQRRQ